MTKEQKKILIVENETPIVHVLELKLNNAGYETTAALNGNEALEAVKKTHFDIILLDLMMPEMDGFSFLENAQGHLGSARVVVMSNLGQKEDIDRAKGLGVDDYFVKSNTSLKKIVEYIKEMLG